MDKKILVIKKTGEHEPFSFNKLKYSLTKSGALEEEVQGIIEKIISEIYDGISSKEIYKKAFKELRRLNRIYASKYSLKKAIFDLGPTGYPFEKLVSALLKEKGFQTEVGVILPGECVTHEIDVLATKDDFTYAVECKFHSNSSNISNVKVPLYINSRFIDIQSKWNKDPQKTTHLKQGWLITNTRFSSDAIKYGKCIGLNLLSWNYPKNKGIKDVVAQHALYPITTLFSLNKREKKMLIDHNIILTKELIEQKNILEKLRFSPQKIKRVLSEAQKLCYL